VLGILAALVFIALNGFFVAAEFALVKVRATQLHARIRRGERRALLAQTVISKLERYLSVTQFGITLASLGLGWIGEPAISRVLTDVWLRVRGAEPGEVSHVVLVVLAFTILTFGHVLFGELVPKLVAIQRSEETALFVALPLRIIYLAFRPLLFILEASTKVLLRSMGLRADAASGGSLAANATRGTLGKERAELIGRVVAFAQRTARTAMVPRVDVVSLPVTLTGKEARAQLVNHQYSRLPLTREKSLDEIAGYIYAKDFLLSPDADSLSDLWPLRRDAVFVPETQNLVDVLREMQRTHTPIAIVVDEYGGTSGIVTMEDLLEEIVGEIRDEFDEEPAHIVEVREKSGKIAWDVDARALMEELRVLGVSVETEQAAEMVGAVVLEELGRVPRKGDKVEIAPHTTATVSAISRRRVTRVRVRVTEPGQAQDAADGADGGEDK
jgi:CBS domain containing-hemolysin-like protein